MTNKHNVDRDIAIKIQRERRLDDIMQNDPHSPQPAENSSEGAEDRLPATSYFQHYTVPDSKHVGKDINQFVALYPGDDAVKVS